MRIFFLQNHSFENAGGFTSYRRGHFYEVEDGLAAHLLEVKIAAEIEPAVMPAEGRMYGPTPKAAPAAADSRVPEGTMYAATNRFTGKPFVEVVREIPEVPPPAEDITSRVTEEQPRKRKNEATDGAGAESVQTPAVEQ